VRCRHADSLIFLGSQSLAGSHSHNPPRDLRTHITILRKNKATRQKEKTQKSRFHHQYTFLTHPSNTHLRNNNHVLKHTFVTQASRHGVSAENIVSQTGTELRTLEKFYRAKNEAKLRHEMQGTVYTAIPFHEWIRKLIPYSKAR
jgi:hypothetical protein